MIRRRRRSDFQESKTGNERWLVSYADFVTLLFAFFVVMYSVSQVNEKKYQVLSDTLSSVFNGKVPVDAQIQDLVNRYPLDDKGRSAGLSPDINLADTKVLASEIQQALINLVDPSDAKISATEDWVQIELSSNLLFPSASAEPSNEARTIFSDIAKLLAPYGNEVEVAGYTDNVPINTLAFKSNWELSSARASSIVRLLALWGVSPERLSAVGFGEYRPSADNQTTEGRSQNRRVVLKVARHQVQQSQNMMAGLQADFPLQALSKDTASISTSSEGRELLLQPEDLVLPEDTASVPRVEPVRLKSGGLLFSSDPELPRNE